MMASENMSELTVSSEGQIVLRAELRRRLGIVAGAKLEVIEEADGVKLRLARPLAHSDVAAFPLCRRLSFMLDAPSRGKPRSLEDFDPASLLSRDAKARS